MAQGITGYFDLTGSVSTFTVRVNYTQTYDAAANKSTLSISSIQVKSAAPSGYYGFTYYPDGCVKINGTTVLSMTSTTPTGSVRIAAQDAWYTVSNAACSLEDIAHNADGSMAVTVELAGNRYTGFRFYTASGSGASGWYVSGSKSVTLTAIPRASAIGATDANIGAVSAIAVTKKSAAYTHSIAYQFGVLSGYITESGGVSAAEVKFSGTSVAFTVPTDFYAQIPSAKTGICTLTCKTYLEAAQIGEAQSCAFTVTASETNCAPTVSGAVVDSNDATVALTGDASKLIRYYSTALCTIAATAKNGASITAKTVGGAAVTGATRSIANVESGSVVFAATDSRGYSASATVSAAMVAYVKLTNNASAARTDPTSGNAALTLKGDYYNDTFGAVDNALTVQYAIGGGEPVTVTPTLSGNAYSASVALTGLDYTQSYSIQVTVADKLAAVTKTVTVGQGVPVFDFGERDFAVNAALLAKGGAIATMPFYYGHDDQTEDGLNAWLDAAMANMTDHSCQFVCFVCYPAVGGVTFYAVLYRHTANYALLTGGSYDYETVMKCRYNGVWKAAVTKSFS